MNKVQNTFEKILHEKTNSKIQNTRIHILKKKHNWNRISVCVYFKLSKETHLFPTNCREEDSKPLALQFPWLVYVSKFWPCGVGELNA